MNIPLLFITSAVVFLLALMGLFLRRRSLIHILLCIELMLMSVNINFVYFWDVWHRNSAPILILFIMGLAAVEVAVGLALILRVFRAGSTIALDSLNQLKE